MCILFMYVAKHSPPQIRRNSFKFILATNRDEFYARPSKPASHWESDPNILGGRDLQSGGTWLGMNVKTGKIGALLNISGGTDLSKDKISRGSLITNFLRSAPGLTGWAYCMNLNQDPSLDIKERFNQFNLVTIDLKNYSTTPTSNPDKNTSNHSDHPLVTYLTNDPTFEYSTNPQKCESPMIAVGNNTIDKPYCKVSAGAKIFEQIILEKEYDSNNKNELKAKLLSFLRTDKRFYPDPILQEKLQGRSGLDHEGAELASSICLHIPKVNYGTRTHTLILVDFDDNVDFHEWTKKEPIDANRDPVWEESNFTFNLNDDTNSQEHIL